MAYAEALNEEISELKAAGADVIQILSLIHISEPTRPY